MIKILLLACFIHVCISARILGIFPIPSLSHQIVFAAITKELAIRGHDVTIIAPHKIQNPPKSLKIIDTTEITQNAFKNLNLDKMSFHSDGVGEVLQHFFDTIPWLNQIFVDEMSDPRVTKLLNNSKFDLIMVETFMPPAYVAAHKFKVPLVSISSFAPEPIVYSMMGAPTHPFIYNMFNLNVDTKTFTGKVKTLYFYIKYMFTRTYFSECDEAAVKIFGENLPSPIDSMKDVDLLLINSYPIVTGLRPTVSTIVNIGGIHIREKRPIPADLKKYLDESKLGVVYVSFGSSIQSNNLPRDKLNVLLDVFKELPYNILWKFENDGTIELSKNIKIEKWLPQNDLLSHPNIKAFITQGGLQSMEEAINNKVPLVGISFMFDQEYNVRRFRDLNIGIDLTYQTLNRKDLKDAILNVVQNESYKNNITQLSKYIKDEQTPALDRAIWWIEYVIRHGGTKHLADPSTKINMFEYLMLDLLTVAIVLFVLVYYSLRFVIYKLFTVELKLKSS